MKKDDVFKEGANSVAKTMEKKIYEWTQDISEHTKRQDEFFVNFADAVIENEEKKRMTIITLLYYHRLITYKKIGMYL